MKILTIEDNIFPPEHDRWPKELQHKYQEADIVLYLFSPYSTYVMKAPSGVKVEDARSRINGKFVYLEGSGSQIVCEMEHEKLLK